MCSLWIQNIVVWQANDAKAVKCILCAKMLIAPWLTWLSWIRTMHGNLKNVPKFSRSHILPSRLWHCWSITVVNFFNHYNYTTQQCIKLFLTDLTTNSFWIIINFIKNINIWFIKRTFCYFPFTNIHIGDHILCRFSASGVIMTSQRRCYTRDLKTLHRFSAMRGSPPSALKLRLQILTSWCIKYYSCHNQI